MRVDSDSHFHRRGINKMELKFLKNFSDIAKKGQTAIVDKIRFDPYYRSGVKVRVINIWKSPKYLDLGWFIKVRK